MYSWLEDAIRRDATIVTANRRLARELRLAHARHRMDAGEMAWLTPSIHSLSGWCRQLIDRHAEPDALPTPIDEFSAVILWDRCLKTHAPDELPAFRGFLNKARDAWQRLCDWNIPLTAVTASARSPDEQLFAAAAADYQARLTSAGWIDAQGLTRLATELLTQRRASAAGEFVFAGFDRLVPAVQQFIDALVASGSGVECLQDTGTVARARVAAFEDHDAELRAAGGWARRLLQDQPGARVAVISPTLQTAAARQARLLREGLAPGWQYGGTGHRTAVNVSYGRRLADFPAIAIALLLLRWLGRGLSTKDVSLLLRSSHLAGGITAGRSRLELHLRKHPDRAWSPDALKGVLQGRDDSADSLAFLGGLDALTGLQREARRDAAPRDWARRFESLLGQWRWPGISKLSSEEFQLVNRWRELLNDFSASSRVMPVLRLAEATERLAALADEVIFQPEADGGRVALMGSLEAAGMQFDHLWVSGLHAGQWPPPAVPSPLLSRGLQKEAGMPDATPADTLRFAQAVLRRLVGSAPDVVLSWPRSDAESELTASSLLDEFAGEAFDDAGDPGWHARGFAHPEQTQIIHSDPAPPVGDDEVVRNGAYTVQRQAVEPLAAFVYGRLGVRSRDDIEAGIASRLRGDVTHDALHSLFADCPSQADMRLWSDKDIEQKLGSAIDAALARPLRHADRTLRRLLALERTRLVSLLRAFIAAELEREAFTVVAVEKSMDFEAFGVRLTLRVDRIDRLADGALLIIDYKTGRPRSLLNRDGEPTDLQLVVYADAIDEPVGGLAFVNIDSRTISYRGAGGSVEWDAASADDWAERLQGWIAEVHANLREIAGGDVRVNLSFSPAEGRALALISRLEEMRRAD